MIRSDDVKKLREEGRRHADGIVATQDEATLEDWRRQIEIGWRQAERGELVDGPTALAEIKERIKGGSARSPEAKTPSSSLESEARYGQQ